MKTAYVYFPNNPEILFFLVCIYSEQGVKGTKLEYGSCNKHNAKKPPVTFKNNSPDGNSNSGDQAEDSVS